MPTAGVPFRPAGQDTSKAQVEMANATLSGSDLLKKALRDQVGHTFTEGLRAILHEWARTGSNTFTFVASPERPAFSVRVVDCSDEDQSALLFSVAPLEDLKRCQRFLVSTEGRGLLKQSQDADTRLFPQLRAKLERVSWEELKHFIESHADTVAS